MAKRKSRKKPARAAKAKRASVKRRPARKARKAKKAKRKVAKAAKRPARKVKKAKTKKARREVPGEGNYTAAREFDRKEKAFVRANKARIPEMGKEAETALEGQEGAELIRAEESARGHAYE